MACRNLVLTDEVFGPAFEQVVIPRLPVRAEWGGIQVLTNIAATTAIVMVNVRTDLVTVGSPNVTVTVPLGGGAEKSVTFPWATAGNGFTQLTGARFTSEFFAVRYTAAQTNGGDYQASYAIFDLRPRAAGQAAPDAVVLGPFALPAGTEHQFCPNGSGQLVMLWHSTGGAQGRVAEVYRTEIPAGISAIQPLIRVDDFTATGTLACQTSGAGTSTAEISIHDQAFRQGLTAVSLTPASRRLMGVPTPRQGKLKLNVRNLTLAAGQASGALQISNDGGDFLEITGVTSSSPAVTVTPNVTLPTCLLPGETVSIAIARTGAGAGTATITVANSPAAPSGANTVAVTLEAATPRPDLRITPGALSWRVGELTTPKSISIRNSGNVPVDVAVPGPAAGSPFTWTPTPLSTLAVGATITVAVTPPPAGPAPVSATLSVTGFLTGTMTALNGLPVSIALNANVAAKVPAGSLRITTILADAPGSDILPEGEFIEITNISGRSLDLNGCSIEHQVFAQGAATGRFQPLIAFGPTAFGADSMLPPRSAGGPTVRVLTRRKATSDPDIPWRLFANRNGPVWNNSGDTGRIRNEFGEVVDQYTFVASYPTDGTTPPAGTVVSPPAARTRVMVRRVYVNCGMDWTTVFQVQEGDVVNVTATGNPHFGGLFGSAGTSGPGGRSGDNAPANDNWPLPGVPKFSLIGSLGPTTFFVGASASITINRDGGPFTLMLGPNDNVVGDNNGAFDVVAVLYR